MRPDNHELNTRKISAPLIILRASKFVIVFFPVAAGPVKTTTPIISIA